MLFAKSFKASFAKKLGLKVNIVRKAKSRDPSKKPPIVVKNLIILIPPIFV